MNVSSFNFFVALIEDIVGDVYYKPQSGQPPLLETCLEGSLAYHESMLAE